MNDGVLDDACIERSLLVTLATSVQPPQLNLISISPTTVSSSSTTTVIDPVSYCHCSPYFPLVAEQFFPQPVGMIEMATLLQRYGVVMRSLSFVIVKFVSIMIMIDSNAITVIHRSVGGRLKEAVIGHQIVPSGRYAATVVDDNVCRQIGQDENEHVIWQIVEHCSSDATVRHLCFCLCARKKK